MNQNLPRRGTSIYDYRWANAQRIGRRIEQELARGSLVWDAEGERVRAVLWEGWRKDNQKGPGLSFLHEGSNAITVYFDCDTEADMGMHTTIPEFNARFANWKAVRPEDIRSLVPSRKAKPLP